MDDGLHLLRVPTQKYICLKYRSLFGTDTPLIVHIVPLLEYSRSETICLRSLKCLPIALLILNLMMIRVITYLVSTLYGAIYAQGNDFGTMLLPYAEMQAANILEA
jgi:hypothetical protein